jgi:GNAT superfamily N-acetyltransferase
VHVLSWQTAFVDYIAADYLARLSVSDFEPIWKDDWLVDPKQITLVAESDAAILGFTSFGSNRDELGDEVGELLTIFVHPQRWNNGVGQGLIEAAERGLIAAGFNEAILWTLTENERTRRFYERNGWMPDGAAKRHRRSVPLALREVSAR